MAQRRMFSPQIIDSDAFLDMSPSSQNLYFHLGMRADDDGFVSNPKKILKMIGGNDDDLKILLGKRFILGFENGVIVIKHWRINNLVRKDWYKPTQYIDEKKSLYIKENGSYTEDSRKGEPLVNESLTKLVQVRQHRLGKVNKTQTAKQSSLDDKNKSMKTYDESKHSDCDIPVVDLETGQIPVIPKKTSKNKLAMRSQQYFVDQAKKNGMQAIPDAKGYFVILDVMKKANLDARLLKQRIDDWFASGIPAEDMVSITRCFSARSVEQWKVKNGIK